MTKPWTVLIPVKSTASGKSRLQLERERRVLVARALARDTVTAVSHCPAVGTTCAVVETEDDAARLTAIAGVDALVVRARGLNEALREALGTLPHGTGPVAILPADLPSLRPADLDEALTRARGFESAVVADRQGVGTTLLAARGAARADPRYGPGSLAAHLRGGAMLLEVPPSSGLRRDVDVLADLCDVTGAHTRAAIDSLELRLPCG